MNHKAILAATAIGLALAGYLHQAIILNCPWEWHHEPIVAAFLGLGVGIIVGGTRWKPDER